MLLDANVVSNLKVQQARAALVRELCTRNCEVFVCNVPTADGVNGPDDHIAAGGDGAMASRLLKNPEECHPEVAPVCPDRRIQDYYFHEVLSLERLLTRNRLKSGCDNGYRKPWFLVCCEILERQRVSSNHVP